MTFKRFIAESTATHTASLIYFVGLTTATTTTAPATSMPTSELTTSGAETTTTQQMSTSEQSSSELTTVSQSSSTSSSPPDIHCCCRCCFPSTPTCKFCDRDTLTDASECANQPPPTPAPVDRNTPKFEAPPALKGSAYPERLAYREDFIKKAKLTETLAALPTNTKVDLGFKTTDLLMDCRFDKKPCSIR